MNRFVVRRGCVAVAAVLGLGVATLGTVSAVAQESGARAHESSRALLQTPVTDSIDISPQPAPGNGLPACHLAGSVTLWASRQLLVLDELLEERGTVEAGLLQFGKGSTLDGCTADNAPVDLSNQFANFLVVNGGAARSEEAAALASQLAHDFYHNRIEVNAVGSVAHEYSIVLIRDAESGAFDAVIHRETVGTKFSPRLPEADRHASRARWSSAGVLSTSAAP
jgi:hypothetical protein